MKDKYLIVYENSSLLLRKEVTSEQDLAKTIEKIQVNYNSTIISVSKIMVTS